MSRQTAVTAHWYLIQCKPRQEERAEQNLKNQSFICYRPEREVERIKRGRKTRVRESLFPGYLFIRLDHEDDNWSLIRSTRGVSRLVRFGDAPAKVDPVIIYNIKQCCDRSDVRPALTAGDRVRIIEGPFRELEAIYLSDSGDERVILMINLLQRQQQLKVPLAAIRAESRPQSLDQQPRQAYAY